MIKFHHACVALGLFLLVGCGPSDQSKEKKQSDDYAKMLAEKSASERQLLADPSRATLQLVQRLRASLKMRDGLLMVDSQSRFRLLGSASEAAVMASIPGGVSLSIRPAEMISYYLAALINNDKAFEAEAATFLDKYPRTGWDFAS
jgi:hypothetical protein